VQSLRKNNFIYSTIFCKVLAATSRPKNVRLQCSTKRKKRIYRLCFLRTAVKRLCWMKWDLMNFKRHVYCDE